MSENTQTPKIQIKKSIAYKAVALISTALIAFMFFSSNSTQAQPRNEPEVNLEAQLEDLQKQKEKAEKLIKATELEKQANELLNQAEQIKESVDSEPEPEPEQADDVAGELLSMAENIKPLEVFADDPTELPPENQWATRIDQFIAETNPNLSNMGCGEAHGQIWVDAGKKYGNHPYFLVAIAVADTSLGNGLTNTCNLGNTGHCDSCASGHQYESFANSIYSISQTISNQYLGKGTKSCHFSVGGWQYCPEGRTINNGKYYASSELNWNRNVNATLAKLFATELRQDFNVKI